MSLSETDFAQAASMLNCEVATIKAIAIVESNGNGFIGPGKPVILFERHLFYKYLLNNNLLPKTYDQSIINVTPGGYTKENEWGRLDKAIKINKPFALQSTSWGMFQILGKHFKYLGYNSVDDFVKEISQSETKQLHIFCMFIKKDRNLLKAIQNKDFKNFAFYYNGPNYRTNEYDTKMQKAYIRFSK